MTDAPRPPRPPWLVPSKPCFECERVTPNHKLIYGRCPECQKLKRFRERLGTGQAKPSEPDPGYEGAYRAYEDRHA